MDRKRRTNPSFLSNDEVARDNRRLEEMVRGITGSAFKDNVQEVASEKIEQVVGETENIRIKFDLESGLIEVYSKDIFTGKDFRLIFNSAESKLLIGLLEKAISALKTGVSEPIGEIPRFIVEADSVEKLAIIYLKATPTTKIGFNQNEIPDIISYLNTANIISYKTFRR